MNSLTLKEEKDDSIKTTDFIVFMVAVIFESKSQKNICLVYRDSSTALEKAKTFSFVNDLHEARIFTKECQQIVASEQEKGMATMLQQDGGILRFEKLRFTPFPQDPIYATVHVLARWYEMYPHKLFLELTAELEENDAFRCLRKSCTRPRDKFFSIDVIIGLSSSI